MIRNTGTLARFAKESGCFSGEKAKQKLFVPNSKGELSVSYVDGLDCAGIIGIGIDVVKKLRDAKRLYGWGEINDNEVRAEGLCVIRDDAPPRHANILKWPNEQQKRKNLANLLASKTQGVRLKTPIPVQTGKEE